MDRPTLRSSFSMSRRASREPRPEENERTAEDARAGGGYAAAAAPIFPAGVALAMTLGFLIVMPLGARLVFTATTDLLAVLAVITVGRPADARSPR